MLKEEVIRLNSDDDLNKNKEEEIQEETKKEKKGIKDFMRDDKVKYMSKNITLVNKQIQCWVKNEGDEKNMVKSELDKTISRVNFKTSSCSIMYDEYIDEILSNIDTWT